jgi:hypothetical protein
MGTAYLYNIAPSAVGTPSDYYQPNENINKTNAAGIHITEASPVDDRLIISTEQEIAILVNKTKCIMYDGMVVTFADSKFIWLESQQGLMAGYTYPELVYSRAELCRKAV